MAATPITALSSGVQTLYNSGLLPDSLTQTQLASTSAAQLNQLAASSLALQQSSVLFGNGTAADSVNLSSNATNALLQQINPSGDYADSTPSSADYLTQAVNNQLTNNIDSAVNKFLPATTTTATNVNVVA